MYNLNEARAVRSEPFVYQKPQYQQTVAAPKENQPKLFDMSELTDLKQ